MANEIDEIDQLLSRIPTVRCKCGNGDKEWLEVRAFLTVKYNVLEINSVSRRVMARSLSDEGDYDYHLWCLRCDTEVTLPTSWSIDFRYNDPKKDLDDTKGTVS